MRSISTLGSIWNRTKRTVSQANADAAAARAAALRTRYPAATTEELVDLLIRRKVLETSAVGAVTSGTALVPGLGTLASFFLGTAADIGVTMRMQSDLLLEVAALHGRQLSADERQAALLIVGGLTVGSEQLTVMAGERIAVKAAQRFAGRGFLKALPIVGIAASAGANAVTTYLIGRRAHAYFSLGPEAVGDWSESVRALTGMDERKIAGWLAESISRVGTGLAALARRTAQSLAGTGWRRRFSRNG